MSHLPSEWNSAPFYVSVEVLGEDGERGNGQCDEDHGKQNISSAEWAAGEQHLLRRSESVQHSRPWAW